jgi:heme-degrading monooxygenase HmoA
MFARMLAFPVRMEEKEEFVALFKNEVLPILKKQPGFLEIIALFPETKNDKVITVSLWSDKHDAERYHRNFYPEIHQILKPYLLAAVEVKPYLVETTLCENFVHALAA